MRSFKAGTARTIATSIVALSVATTAAQAQSQEQERPQGEPGGDVVVVTATKRASSVQDVPFSINAQSAEDIRKSGAVTLEDLARNVAGVAVQNLGPGQSQVAIRGVSAGQVVRDQPGVKEQVGVYLDESVVSMSLFTPDFDLYDLNRVETLRGPQGTLFGSGSVGGTIRYITSQPRLGWAGGSMEANVNMLSGGDWGGHLKGAVNVPLGAKVAARAVGYATRYGGFIDALREGGKVDENVNSGSRIGGRLAVTFAPDDAVRLTPRIVYQEVRADGFNRQDVYNMFANPYTTTRPAIQLGKRQQYLLLPERFEDKTMLADLTASLDISGASFTSVTSYIKRDILVSRDASALSGSVSADLKLGDAAVRLPSNLRDTTDLKQFTQELRVASTGSGAVQWVVGGFYSNVDRDYQQRLPTPGYDAYEDAALGRGTAASLANGYPADSPYNSSIPYKTEQKALFGEMSMQHDAFKLTTGLRYYDFSESRVFKSGGLFANGDNNRDSTASRGVTPRFLASYKANDNVTLNLQAAKGFRLGGVNDPLNLPLCSAGDAQIFGGYKNYQDETLWNYEMGVKSRWGPGTSFNAAVFRTDISNLQVTLDAGSCSSRVVFNVPRAHSQGVEFEFNARPTPGLDLALNGSVLDSKFDSTVMDGTGAVIGGIRTGNRLPSVPKFQISGNARYSWPWGGMGNGFVQASASYVGDRFTQPSDQENNPRTFVHGLTFGGAPASAATTVDLNLPAYTLVNLSTGFETESGLGVSLYANNIFDQNPLLSFDRERGGRARLGFQVGQPRQIGVTVRKSF